MQVEPKAYAAVGRRALGRDLRSDILDIPIRGLARIRRLHMKMINFESHGNLPNEFTATLLFVNAPLQTGLLP